METLLRDNLICLVERYIALTGKAETTVARMASADTRFFLRVRDKSASFTVARYDRVVAWFSDNWPDGAEWPAGIERPMPEEAAP